MIRLTPEEASRMGIAGAPKPQEGRSPTSRTKYRNVRARAYGRLWASQAECRRYGFLLSRGQAGEIRNLELQPRYRLESAGLPVAVYIGDFAFEERWAADMWVRVVEDVKSPVTAGLALYRLKIKLFRSQYPEIVFREVRLTRYSRDGIGRSPTED